MLYRVEGLEIWLANPSGRISSLSRDLSTRRKLCSSRYRPLKSNSGPTAPLKEAEHRGSRSHPIPHTSHSASFKDMEVFGHPT
ncbi:hypothetical protein AVEN_213444-1 [Araneus ventricosus]|uniref:Uncharacterized protein n=1 Tax=Araneus ventricosus TaxID=182803 RepID=A0A4Y2JUZ9_ARAVE|nr:hypothetical protein AVEN_213444-1 [Araneus ventricosus]